MSVELEKHGGDATRDPKQDWEMDALSKVVPRHPPLRGRDFLVLFRHPGFQIAAVFPLVTAIASEFVGERGIWHRPGLAISPAVCTVVATWFFLELRLLPENERKKIWTHYRVRTVLWNVALSTGASVGLTFTVAPWLDNYGNDDVAPMILACGIGGATSGAILGIMASVLRLVFKGGLFRDLKKSGLLVLVPLFVLGGWLAGTYLMPWYMELTWSSLVMTLTQNMLPPREAGLVMATLVGVFIGVAAGFATIEEEPKYKR